MNTEKITNCCIRCQVPLPADAAPGLCANCLRIAAAETREGQPQDRQLSPPPIEAVIAAFPDLEVLEMIGYGGMGVVYKARQPRLDRVVALKLLPHALAADSSFTERFSREARVLARLNHPNIVTVFDCGQSGGFFFLLMEFVDGLSLRQAMRGGRFSLAKTLSIIPGICEALQFAHDEGILHRDIKPENILLDSRGRVKIADFGIAKLVGGADKSATLTASGMMVGTPHYMAPEQFEHPHDVDQRADLYSLGVVFYEMLTGELPLGRFAPPSEAAGVDPRLDEVVLRALEKEREKRYRSAREVKTSVEAIQARSNDGAPQANFDEVTGENMAGGDGCIEPFTSGPGSGFDRPHRPFWWTVSAWVFVGIGVLTLIDTLAAMYSRPRVPAFYPGLAHLVTGIALLTLSRRWRVVAIGALSLALACGVFIGVMMAVSPEHAVISFPGIDVSFPVLEKPRWAAAGAVLLAVLLGWPSYLLLSRKARKLFGIAKPRLAPLY